MPPLVSSLVLSQIDHVFNTCIEAFIEKRYDRWLDYAKYHCSLAGMSSEAIDVLNEVMCMLLQKPLEHLSRLMEAKQGKYTELDWYILQMIKLNVTSDTSPYRHKYKPFLAHPYFSYIFFHATKIRIKICLRKEKV